MAGHSPFKNDYIFLSMSLNKAKLICNTIVIFLQLSNNITLTAGRSLSEDQRQNKKSTRHSTPLVSAFHDPPAC